MEHYFWLTLISGLIFVKESMSMTRYGEACFDGCTKRRDWRGKDPAQYSCHKAKMYYDNLILGTFFKKLSDLMISQNN